jgi:hypothetical protein
MDREKFHIPGLFFHGPTLKTVATGRLLAYSDFTESIQRGCGRISGLILFRRNCRFLAGGPK